MEVKGVPGEQAEVLLSADEIKELAALAIAHSDNEELIAGLQEAQNVATANKSPKGEVSNQAEELQPKSALPTLKPPKAVGFVTAKDILSPKELEEAVHEGRAQRAAAQANLNTSRRAKAWRRSRTTLF